MILKRLKKGVNLLRLMNEGLTIGIDESKGSSKRDIGFYVACLDEHDLESVNGKTIPKVRKLPKCEEILLESNFYWLSPPRKSIIYPYSCFEYPCAGLISHFIQTFPERKISFLLDGHLKSRGREDRRKIERLRSEYSIRNIPDGDERVALLNSADATAYCIAKFFRGEYTPRQEVRKKIKERRIISLALSVPGSETWSDLHVPALGA